MPRIERYVLRGVARPVLGVFLALMAVVLVFYVSRGLARAAADQWPLWMIGAFSGLRLGIFLDILLPVAMFLGIIIGLGRLQSSYEVIAMAALGTGLRRILAATMVPALVVAVIVGALSAGFRPWAYGTLYALEDDMATRVDLRLIETGRFQALSDEWLIFAEGRRDGALADVLVRQRDHNHDSLLRAEQLHLEVDPDGQRRLVFSGGVNMYRFGRAGVADWTGRFGEVTVAFAAPDPPTRRRLRRMQPMEYLLASDAPIDKAELQWRLHGPIGVLVLALAALPLSRINPRRGQSTRLLGGTLFVTFYYSLFGTMISWVENERVAPWPGAFWVPMLAFAGLAVHYWWTQRHPGAPL
jgi:lipopolysaccharide export system permease protein